MDKMPVVKLPLYGGLGKGKFALVDGDYDGEYFSQYKWYLLKNGYAGRVEVEVPAKERKGYIYLHTVVSRPPKGLWVDHINRNKLDNRSCNLRWVTPSENALNKSQGAKRRSKSGYRGVTKRPDFTVTRVNKGGVKTYSYKGGLYTASIKGKHLGYFEDAVEAAKAYDVAARAAYGDLATTNF